MPIISPSFSVIAVGLLLCMLLQTISPLSAHADTVARHPVRLEVEATEIDKAQSTWQRLTTVFRAWIGSRRPAIIKPPIGTKFTVSGTAYASSPYQTDSTPCITAVGTRVRPGVVASNFLPFGTILEIKDSLYIVEDRMNPRYTTNALDIWHESTSAALDFGRQKFIITVVGYGKPGQELTKKILSKESLLPEPVPRKVSPLRTLPQQLADAGRTVAVFLMTRSVDVNRFDVDCFALEKKQ